MRKEGLQKKLTSPLGIIKILGGNQGFTVGSGTCKEPLQWFDSMINICMRDASFCKIFKWTVFFKKKAVINIQICNYCVI